MSRNNRNTAAAALGVALAGMVLAGSSFAMQPLAKGYATSATKVAAEGKCGEGKCGDEKFASIDTDHDARVSRAEFLKVAPGQNALFGTKDTDHDGYISELESYKSIKGIYEANGRSVPAGNAFVVFAVVITVNGAPDMYVSSTPSFHPPNIVFSFECSRKAGSSYNRVTTRWCGTSLPLSPLSSPRLYASI